MDISDTLRQVFGFEQFLPGQEEIIGRLVQGKSALAIFPTGYGKSLCYQLTALHLPGLTLVVSPLMALMKDQVDFLRERQVFAARLDSSLSQEEYHGVRSDFISGRLKLLYVAPERFGNERFLADLNRVDISMIVVDEAHCISEWGHNFRPDYLKLPGLAASLKIPLSLCLTATATTKVAQDILASFAIKREDFVHTGFYRPNLTLRFSPSAQPLEMLLCRLQERQPGSVIVYVTLQATAEEVAGRLVSQGFAARPYHAGLEAAERKDVQEWFMASSQAVVVATIAFGMGIDKQDIRYVYHYNLPKSLENYAQEIGRAGRDGEPAICEVLGSSRDLVVLENFSYGDTPDDQGVRDLTTMITSQPDDFAVSVSELAQQFDMRPLVVNTMLTYLELEGVMTSTGPFYTTYKFIPHRSSEEIFARFDEERKTFLRSIFGCAKKAKKWFSLDIDEAAARGAGPRKRIIAALNYLEELGDLELQVSGMKKGYRKTRKLTVKEDQTLSVSLQEKFKRQEEWAIQRLGLVVELIRYDGCQTGFLLDYFGEKLPGNCGHCEYCISGNSGKGEFQADERSRHMESGVRQKLADFLVEYEEHPALLTPRQQARFFCGLSSPRSSRAGLQRLDAFGILAKQPFARVKEWLEKRRSG